MSLFLDDDVFLLYFALILYAWNGMECNVCCTYVVD